MRPGLHNHVTALPDRVELGVEPEQVVQLEGQDSLQPQQRPALQPLDPRQLGLGGQQPGERREVQRDVREPLAARPRRRFHDQPGGEAIGGVGAPRHRGQGQRLAGRGHREMQEPGDLAELVPADHEHGVVTAQPEQAVEFHREARPRPAAQPGILDGGQFRPQRRRHLPRHDDLGAESLALQPVHGLPGGPHVPAVQGEAPGVDDRLIAVIQRVQPLVPVGLQQPVRRAHDRGAPSAGLRVGQEILQRRPRLLRRTDRVTADQGDTADDPVGDQRLPADEQFLVEAQGERRQRVTAPAAHDVRRLLA
jgi:hypothetical protein